MEKQPAQLTSTPARSVQLPRWEELPDIDLYIEQVLSLLALWLEESFYTDDKPLMTKTMVNNYVKQGVIAAPVNKKYDRLAVASLFAICILKTVYSMQDIAKLIHLALEVNTPGTSYDRFCDTVEQAVEAVYTGSGFPARGDRTDAQYLLRTVALSFACTCFSRDSYLSKV
ncbi:MAG TPA: DUF1836 domain-containing protein [Clostridiales bacterium]|jgi:hypothetical protein|nr:DUF1836 domain-containing protein [Clostridiales bacterium]